MSPFWKNVDKDMNIKTLSKLSAVPYPTITNGRNRKNSVPEMETAQKIAEALHKPLEGIQSNVYPKTDSDAALLGQTTYLYQKYQDIITIFESLPASLRESLRNTITKFYETYIFAMQHS